MGILIYLFLISQKLIILKYMEKSSSKLIYLIKKKWTWGDCKLVIRRTNLAFHN